MCFLIIKQVPFKSYSQLERIFKSQHTYFQKKKKGCRKLRVLLVLKSLGSLNEVVLWLKSLPWSVTWAFPFCSPIISWACGAQPNPSSSKRCGQQSARCDHQLITHYPPDQAQSLHRCEASLVLNTLTGRSAADERLPQTGFVKGFVRTVKLFAIWESGCSEGRSKCESTIRLIFKLRLNYFLLIVQL